MKIDVLRIYPDTENFPFIRAEVSLHETDIEQPYEDRPLQSAQIEVWLPATDAPLKEIESSAVAKVKDFLAAALKSLESK